MELTKNSFVSFEHALNCKTDASTQGFYIREGENGAWQELEVKEWPAGNKWDYVKSGTIDLRNCRTVIFDLNGRRVEKAERGVYIINGVKTVVR